MAGCSDTALQYLAFVNAALRAVGRNKLRSFLSILGVVFGVMAVMTIICVGQGARIEAVRRVEQLGTRNIYLKQLKLSPGQKTAAGRRHTRGLNREDLERLQKAPIHIRQVAVLKELSVPVLGALQQITPQIAACSANYAGLLNLKTTDGRFIRQQDIDRHHLICVLGRDVAEKLGKSGRPDEKLRIGDQMFTIVGRLNQGGLSDAASTAVSVRNHNEMILLPLGVGQWLAGAGPPARKNPEDSEFSEIIIEISDSSHVISNAAVIRRIMEQAHNGITDYQMVVPLELLHQFRRTNDMFSLFLGAIAGISLVVGGIGIMNIMLANISERKKEIGIRRAVGATKAHIIVQFLAESTLLTLAGGFIGVFFGAIAAYAIAVAAPWHAVLSLSAVMLPLGMSIFVGLFFGLYPAYRAADVDPIQALRFE